MTQQQPDTTPPARTLRELDLNDVALARVLSHPLRLRILSHLADGHEASPKEMAAALDVPLEGFSYHTRALRDAGFIELVRRDLVRGAVKHIYRIAAARPRISDELWAQLPEVVREAFTDSWFEVLLDEVARALRGGGFAMAEAVLFRQPMVLDEEAFRRVSGAVHDLVALVQELEAEARERIDAGRSTVYPGTLATIFFRSPEDTRAVPDIDQPGREGARRRAARLASGPDDDTPPS